MKRSEINAIIKEFECMLKEYRFAIPPYLSFTPEEWLEKGHEYDEIRDNALGWDVSDYGSGNYKELGLALITIRNGNFADPRYPKPYAEKIIMLRPGQRCPNHYHWTKLEDIINRGGGDVLFHLWNTNEKGELLDTDVKIMKDGCTYMAPAGADIILKPGESLTLMPLYYHEFSIPKDSEPTLIGEVSMCNDDKTDNGFLEPLGRYPAIEEDEPPYRLLCTEYPPAKD